MTYFHTKYWAHALTLKKAASSIQSLSRSIASAKVDLNPHQVHAALFALQSPFSRGVILADEVGLGKTIEAGLVIAQKWAEKKRNILLIVPAFLRKQWELELKEKFYLPARILDSKGLGAGNPFEASDEILICSYQFAAQYANSLRKKWDLVIIDEAHRMRNVYKTSNKQAKAISDALRDNFKDEGFKIVLLTATPLQNNLMELYGLVSVIDPYAFGDEMSFRDQYVSRNEEERNKELKRRLQPLIVRTLRKQVQEYIPFTKRKAITQNFTPNDDEQSLYEAVSAYLQRDDLAALPNSQRQLITLILRRILASSSFAITETLKKMIERLETAGQKSLYEEMSLEQIEALDEELKERILSTAPDQEIRAEKEKVRQEAIELRSYLALAERIQKNSKGEALLVALVKAFNQAVELGASKKAVIFTESTRTQAYLYNLLSENGYAGKVIRINGSNNDPDSKAIYQAWLEQQDESGRRSSSRAVDMKAALVAAFRDQGTILLATEAAAEGVNLQFASLVVNYDLPWNPQRIEQRIGRCHRYGQKHDVVVVNFVNTRNEADKRVFELLNEKFKLFDGVFGASDEVLGAIESGVDIELRIHQVYQTCRTSEEIQQAFDQLREELDEQIQANLQKTRQNILDHFDEEVSSLLKTRQAETESALGQRERWLLNLTCQELNQPSSSDRSFIHEGIRYCPDWRLAEQKGWMFFREEDPLAIDLIQRALHRPLSPARLIFDYSSYDQKLSLLEPLQGHSGWIELSRMAIDTFERVESFIFCGISDDGEIIDPEACEKLFQLSGQLAERAPDEPVPSFASQREKLKEEAILEAESLAGGVYDQEVEKLEEWSDDLKEGLEREINDLNKQIKQARKGAALSKTLADKLTHQRNIRNLETQKAEKRRALFAEQDRIDLQRDELISRHEKRLTPNVSIEPIFTIRWSVE